MFDLGPHSGFIWVSYFLVVTVLICLICWIFADGRRQRHNLAQLESQGVRRRMSVNRNEGEFD